MFERRRSRRVETAIKVDVRGAYGWMMAHDIGPGGMLVTTNLPRWPGALIRVRFNLPGNDQAINATCRVINLVEAPRGVGLALTFLKLDPAAESALRTFVRGDRSHLRLVGVA